MEFWKSGSSFRCSTGIHEAVELRDNDKGVYLGKGVLKAMDNVNSVLNKELKGISIFDQNKLDKLMMALDGSETNQDWELMLF